MEKQSRSSKKRRRRTASSDKLPPDLSVEDPSTAPEWVRDIVNPNWTKAISRTRSLIEAHTLSPKSCAGQRKEVFWYLYRRRAPLNAHDWSSRWHKLRERMKEPLPNGEPAVFVFFEEVLKAMNGAQESLWQAERVNEARAQTPNRRQMAKLLDPDRVAELQKQRDELSESKALKFDRRPIHSFRLTKSGEDKLREDLGWEIRVGDVLDPKKLRPGSGRSLENNEGRDTLMRVLTLTFRLSVGNAAAITADVLLWFTGQEERGKSIERRWRVSLKA